MSDDAGKVCAGIARLKAFQESHSLAGLSIREMLEEGRNRCIAGEPGRKGGILEALRRSPLVGSDVIPPRPFETGRKVDR